jgi:hypothetical protein
MIIMPSKGKIKGSGFERDTAKYLSELYGESFIRNLSGSGAAIGGKNSFRKATLSESQVRNTKGDIVPPDSWPYFNAEVKFYNDLLFHQLLSDCPQLDGWIKQLSAVADENDTNIIFFKINHKGKYVVVERSRHWDLTNINFIVYKDWYVVDLEEFFKYNKGIFEKHCRGS